jgi:hypothetical protein
MLLSLPVSKNELYPNKFNLHYPKPELNVGGNLSARLSGDKFEAPFFMSYEDIKKPMTQVERTIRDNDIEEKRILTNKGLNKKQELEDLMLNEFRQKAKNKRDERLKTITDNTLHAMKQGGLVDPTNEDEIRDTIQKQTVKREVEAEIERINQTATARGNAQRVMDQFIRDRLDSMRADNLDRNGRPIMKDLIDFTNSAQIQAPILGSAQSLGSALSRNADELSLSFTGRGIAPSPQAQLLGRTEQSRAPISYRHVAGGEGAGGESGLNFTPSPNLNFNLGSFGQRMGYFGRPNLLPSPNKLDFEAIGRNLGDVVRSERKETAFYKKAGQAVKNQELLQAMKDVKRGRINKIAEEVVQHDLETLQAMARDVSAGGSRKMLNPNSKGSARAQLSSVLFSPDLTAQQRITVEHYRKAPKLGNKVGAGRPRAKEEV